MIMSFNGVIIVKDVAAWFECFSKAISQRLVNLYMLTPNIRCTAIFSYKKQMAHQTVCQSKNHHNQVYCS